MKIKAIINKCDLIKLKSFYTTKETINQMKRQPMEWEKIFANDGNEKGLILKIYKESMQPQYQTQKPKQPNPIKF